MPELAHLRDAVGPVDGGLLREVAQLLDRVHRVVVRGGDLGRARARARPGRRRRRHRRRRCRGPGFGARARRSISASQLGIRSTPFRVSRRSIRAQRATGARGIRPRAGRSTGRPRDGDGSRRPRRTRGGRRRWSCQSTSTAFLYFFTPSARVSLTWSSHGRGTLALSTTTFFAPFRMSIIRSKSSGLTVPFVPSCTTTSSPSWPVSRYSCSLSTPAENCRLSSASTSTRSAPIVSWSACAAPSITESPTAVTCAGNRDGRGGRRRGGAGAVPRAPPRWSLRRGCVVVGLSTSAADGRQAGGPRGGSGAAAKPSGDHEDPCHERAADDGEPGSELAPALPSRPPELRQRRPSAPWRIGSSTYL